jgi:hypothetical protein
LRRLRTLIAGGAAAALVVAGAAAATADDIYNNLDASIDATVEVMPLDVNGAFGSTILAVNPTNGDGKNGCNITGQTSVVLNVKSSDPAVAIVSPSSVTFTSCGDTRQLTVTPLAEGSTTISLELVSNTSQGTFDLAPATFRVDVTAPAPTNTAPTVAIGGVTDGATYTYGQVPVAMCEVSDAEDGDSSFAATLSGGDEGIGLITASCSHEDSGGLTGSATATYTVIKATPIVKVTCDPASVVYTGAAHDICSATVEGVDLSGGVPVTYDDNINAGTVTATATFEEDAHHDSATAYGNFEITKASSTVTLVCPESEWFTGSVIEPCTATVTGAGVFTKAPVITYTGDTTKAGVVNVTAQYPGDDNHEASPVVSDSYEIKGFTLNGFYKPVDMDKVNTVKGGSTVPLKFEVLLNGVEQTSTSVVDQFTARQVSCSLNDGVQEEDVDFTTTGGTSLRYDTKDGQFIQNWQTPKKAGSCYTVTMRTIDGGVISADFKLK